MTNISTLKLSYLPEEDSLEFNHDAKTLVSALNWEVADDELQEVVIDVINWHEANPNEDMGFGHFMDIFLGRSDSLPNLLGRLLLTSGFWKTFKDEGGLLAGLRPSASIEFNRTEVPTAKNILRINLKAASESEDSPTIAELLYVSKEQYTDILERMDKASEEVAKLQKDPNGKECTSSFFLEKILATSKSLKELYFMTLYVGFINSFHLGAISSLELLKPPSTV